MFWTQHFYFIGYKQHNLWARDNLCAPTLKRWGKTQEVYLTYYHRVKTRALSKQCDFYYPYVHSDAMFKATKLRSFIWITWAMWKYSLLNKLVTFHVDKPTGWLTTHMTERVTSIYPSLTAFAGVKLFLYTYIIIKYQYILYVTVKTWREGNTQH